jgi:hypothetical protein
MQCSGWIGIDLPIADSDLDPRLQYGSGSRAMNLANDSDRKLYKNCTYVNRNDLVLPVVKFIFLVNKKKG